MIAQLRGKIVSANLTEVILDVNGVGYRVFIPVSTYDALPREGGEALLLTHMHVREDAIQLFGFSSRQELLIFELLITVNGIGAKTALNILSSLNSPSFCSAVAAGDVRSLKKINGVGPKSAERMIVELRDKIESIMPEFSTAVSGERNGSSAAGSCKELDDALLALEQLGFQRAKIQKLVTEISFAIPEEQRSSENIIRKALQSLNK